MLRCRYWVTSQHDLKPGQPTGQRGHLQKAQPFNEVPSPPPGEQGWACRRTEGASSGIGPEEKDRNRDPAIRRQASGDKRPLEGLVKAAVYVEGR